ncbi:toxin-antitoxin system YwqK family antitoxin [Vibrio sp. WXL103]|uniref:toxin-antitoxin system YwqK family antitoxin n=1 Tax=Vibrio sp. WXL103 TaxID=3450710 RepID=UPI003EC88E88
MALKLNVLGLTIVAFVSYAIPQAVQAEHDGPSSPFAVDVQGLGESVLMDELTTHYQGLDVIRSRDGAPFTGQVVDDEGRHVKFYVDGQHYGPFHSYRSGRIRQVERVHEGVTSGWQYSESRSSPHHYLMLQRAKFGRSAYFSEASAEAPLAGNFKDSYEYHWNEEDGFRSHCCYDNGGYYVSQHRVGSKLMGIERVSVAADGTAKTNKLHGLTLNRWGRFYSNSFTGIIDSYHDVLEQDLPQARIGLKKGNPHGEMKFINNKGHNVVEVNFVDGLRHGIERRWYGKVLGAKAPQLKTERHFKNGLYHGIERYWSTNGALLSENSYKDDRLNGVSRIWNLDGDLLIESEYVDGVLHGEERYIISATDDRAASQLILLYEQGRLVSAKLWTEG